MINELNEMHAMLAFVAKAPRGNKELLGDQQHIDYSLTLEGKPLAAIMLINDMPTLAQLATLEAYKNGRGYKFGYVLWYDWNNVYYQELNQIEGTIKDGKVFIPATNWKYTPYTTIKAMTEE